VLKTELIIYSFIIFPPFSLFFCFVLIVMLCPSGATCLPADCWFSVLALLKNQLSALV